MVSKWLKTTFMITTLPMNIDSVHQSNHRRMRRTTTTLIADHLYQNLQICGLSHSQIVGFKCSLPHYSVTSLVPPIEKSLKS